MVEKQEKQTYIIELFLDIEKTGLVFYDASEDRHFYLDEILRKKLGLNFEGNKQISKGFKITFEELIMNPPTSSATFADDMSINKVLEIAARLNLPISELGGDIKGFMFVDETQNLVLIFGFSDGNIIYDLYQNEPYKFLHSGQLETIVPSLEEEIAYLQKIMQQHGFKLEDYTNPPKLTLLTEMQILKLISWISQHQQRHLGNRIDYEELEAELKTLDLGEE